MDLADKADLEVKVMNLEEFLMNTHSIWSYREIRGIIRISTVFLTFPRYYLDKISSFVFFPFILHLFLHTKSYIFGSHWNSYPLQDSG